MNEQTPDDGSELGPVRVTIAVTAGPRRRRPARPGRASSAAPARRPWPKAPARGSGRTLLSAGGLILAIASVAMVVGTPGAHDPPASPDRQVPAAASADSEATMLGFRVDCPLLAIVSPDGRYARADYEMATPCGSYGNCVTVILHRVRGVWVRQFVGTGLRCSASSLPMPVLVELQICPEPAFNSFASVVRPQRPAY